MEKQNATFNEDIHPNSTNEPENLTNDENPRLSNGSPKKSKNKEYLDKYKESGRKIPICINENCFNEVAIRHWTPQGDPSLKTECGRCSSARIKGKELPGIVFHKKIYCENKDGRLGFKCPMDPNCYSEFPRDCYDMDHLDGDHHNNIPDNLITICKVCHARKGKENGDFNSQKASSRSHK